MQDAMAHGGADGRGEKGEWAGRGGAGRGGKCLFSCVTFCASEIMGDHCPIRQSLSPKKGTPTRPGSSSPSSCFSKALSSIYLHSPFLSNPPPHPHLSTAPHPSCKLFSHSPKSFFSPQPLLPCFFLPSPRCCFHHSRTTRHHSHLRNLASPCLQSLNTANPRTSTPRPNRDPLPDPALHAHIITAFASVTASQAFIHSKKSVGELLIFEKEEKNTFCSCVSLPPIIITHTYIYLRLHTSYRQQITRPSALH